MSFAVRKIEEPMMPLTSSKHRIEQAETADESSASGRVFQSAGPGTLVRSLAIPSPVRREIRAVCRSAGR